jgi:hypothetical protein
MAELLPLRPGINFPFMEHSGQMIYASCFAGAFILWSMGIAWIIVGVLSIFPVVRKGKIPFSMAYWGMVFPHGTFASLSVRLAIVLDSSFYRVFGALWCCAYFQITSDSPSEPPNAFSKGVVFGLWVWIFTRSIPAFIDGSLFKAPYVLEEQIRRKSVLETEKGRENRVEGQRSSLFGSETKPCHA